MIFLLYQQKEKGAENINFKPSSEGLCGAVSALSSVGPIGAVKAGAVRATEVFEGCED